MSLTAANFSTPSAGIPWPPRLSKGIGKPSHSLAVRALNSRRVEPVRVHMFLTKPWALLAVLAPLLAHANGDCVHEEKLALAAPGVRQDLKGLQLADVQVHSTVTLKERVQMAERATATPAATLYACLARAELQRREGGNTAATDDPKTRGRSARVM